MTVSGERHQAERAVIEHEMNASAEESVVANRNSPLLKNAQSVILARRLLRAIENDVAQMRIARAGIRRSSRFGKPRNTAAMIEAT